MYERTPFPDIGKGWTNYVEIWCVVICRYAFYVSHELYTSVCVNLHIPASYLGKQLDRSRLNLLRGLEIN